VFRFFLLSKKEADIFGLLFAKNKKFMNRGYAIHKLYFSIFAASKKHSMQEKILILDFGSQYTQLIGRRVRELNIYCEIHPFNHFPAIDESVKGVILSGSPFSVRDKNAPVPDLSAIKGKIPVLGV
jgi:carbamoylphosphate synthase small subunit